MQYSENLTSLLSVLLPVWVKDEGVQHAHHFVMIYIGAIFDSFSPLCVRVWKNHISLPFGEK